MQDDNMEHANADANMEYTNNMIFVASDRISSVQEQTSMGLNSDGSKEKENPI